MIRRSLYRQLALTLFVLLCLVGVILVQLLGHSSNLYQQEVTQKLNAALAQHILADRHIAEPRQLDPDALDNLFHQLMVINPSIELYLLDRDGRILDYNAPAEKIRRSRVSLEPIRQFLGGEVMLPIKGDDPRALDRQKVFSAAAITNQDGEQGYLYIVLGGEQYDRVAEMISNSHILESALVVLLAALVIALVSGLVVFALQTRRLRLLSELIRHHAGKGEDDDSPMRFPETTAPRDEIDELGHQFNIMADKINEQLQELRRIDGSRREMVANVSHDLRTPLTTMRGYLETLVLKHEDLTAEEIREYLDVSLRHSQYMGDLVESLFELARLDNCESIVEAEPFSMAELVQDVTQALQLRAQQQAIQLKVTLNPKTPLIHGDIGMMQRVLENLIENGLRHTPQGGRIEVKVDIDSGHVVVQVADTGSGIPSKDIPKIFERFYQQASSRGSAGHAGLGLAIARRILELHGGAIHVHSKLNHGTTFSFQMPTPEGLQ